MAELKNHSNHFFLCFNSKRYGTRVKRFAELRRLIPDATQEMLTQQLREMERDGVVARKIYHEVPPKVEYSLTKYGLTLRPVMAELCEWGERHRKITQPKSYRRTAAAGSAALSEYGEVLAPKPAE